MLYSLFIPLKFLRYANHIGTHTDTPLGFKRGVLAIHIVFFPHGNKIDGQSRGAVCHACKPDEVGRFNFRLTSPNSVSSIFIRLVQVRTS